MKTTALIAVLFGAFIHVSAVEAQLILSSSSVMERSAATGERYEGQIHVTNTSAVPQSVKVYQTDYTLARNGEPSYGAPGASPRSNAHWIRLPARGTVIPPGGKSTIRYTVTVPAAAALSGTYWSMVMVEAEDRAQDAASNTAGGAAIRTRFRYAVQVATHVGSASPVRVVFDSVRATNAETGRRLTYDFINSGDRAARLLMSVELFDGSGTSVRKLEQQRGLLYPGHSARQNFDFGALPAGTYTAIVTADAGGDEMFGAQYTLRF